MFEASRDKKTYITHYWCLNSEAGCLFHSLFLQFPCLFICRLGGRHATQRNASDKTNTNKFDDQIPLLIHLLYRYTTRLRFITTATELHETSTTTATSIVREDWPIEIGIRRRRMSRCALANWRRVFLCVDTAMWARFLIGFDDDDDTQTSRHTSTTNNFRIVRVVSTRARVLLLLLLSPYFELATKYFNISANEKKQR